MTIGIGSRDRQRNGKRAWPAPRALLAVNDPTERVTLTRALSLGGYEVMGVTDGGHALERLQRIAERRERALDVIVADAALPVCAGVDLLEVLRRAGWQTPVVLMVDVGFPALQSRMKDFGAILLYKPFVLSELFASIRKAVSRRVGRDVLIADDSAYSARDRTWRNASVWRARLPA